MTTLTFFLLLFGLWSSIHLIHRLYYGPSDKQRHLLPTSLVTRKRKLTTVTLTGPYLRVESTAFNSRHDTLAQWLSRTRSTRFRATLLAVFDTGIVVSLLGMAVALVVLAWTFVQLARRSMMADLIPQSAETPLRAKRAYDATSTSRAAADVPVQLLVRRSHLIYSCLLPIFVAHSLVNNRYPESPFPSHTFLYSSPRFLSHRQYTRQGTLSQPHCSSRVTPPLPSQTADAFPTGMACHCSPSAHP